MLNMERFFFLNKSIDNVCLCMSGVSDFETKYYLPFLVKHSKTKVRLGVVNSTCGRRHFIWKNAARQTAGRCPSLCKLILLNVTRLSNRSRVPASRACSQSLSGISSASVHSKCCALHHCMCCVFHLSYIHLVLALMFQQFCTLTTILRYRLYLSIVCIGEFMKSKDFG